MLKLLASGIFALALVTPLAASAHEVGAYGYYDADDGHGDCDDRVRRHDVYRERHSWRYAAPVVGWRTAYPPPYVVARPYFVAPPYAVAPPFHRWGDHDDWQGDGDHDHDDWHGDQDDWHHDRW